VVVRHINDMKRIPVDKAREIPKKESLEKHVQDFVMEGLVAELRVATGR
jgi:hypothetical protein